MNQVTEDKDLVLLTNPQLVVRYNQLVRELLSLGCTSYRMDNRTFSTEKDVKLFADKPTSVRRVQAAESELIAWKSGQRTADAQPESTTGLQTSENPGTVSPGRARLLNSGRAEEIRQAVVADQEAAAALAAGQEPEKAEGTRKMAKKAKAKAKKANGNAPREAKERKVRALKWSDDQIITKLVEGNPKRGASQAVFALYRSGMKVGSFIAKAIEMGLSRGQAGTHLSWDSNTERKGGQPLIKIS